jgi:hypothetical protein
MISGRQEKDSLSLHILVILHFLVVIVVVDGS